MHMGSPSTTEREASMLSKDFVFSSQRLRFHGIRKEDAELIVSWRNDPDNYRNFLNAKPITLESHLKWFEGYLDDDTRFDFIIEDSSGTPIGTCGLSEISESGCEISYMIGALDARGKGYATEAIKALSELAFRELGVPVIEARILSHNVASRKAVEKCGFCEHNGVYALCRE